MAPPHPLIYRVCRGGNQCQAMGPARGTGRIKTRSPASLQGSHTHYEWHGRGPSASQLRRRRLSALVTWSFEDSDGTYGYRRVHAHLARLGEHADPETIRLLMRDLGLVACQPRPWRPTTTVAGDAASTPDLLLRDFTCQTPATKLVGDITYIRTWEGWLYLATVLD